MHWTAYQTCIAEEGRYVVLKLYFPRFLRREIVEANNNQQVGKQIFSKIIKVQQFNQDISDLTIPIYDISKIQLPNKCGHQLPIGVAMMSGI
jgi:hypothetical protein